MKWNWPNNQQMFWDIVGCWRTQWQKDLWWWWQHQFSIQTYSECAQILTKSTPICRQITTVRMMEDGWWQMMNDEFQKWQKQCIYNNGHYMVYKCMYIMNNCSMNLNHTWSFSNTDTAGSDELRRGEEDHLRCLRGDVATQTWVIPCSLRRWADFLPLISACLFWSQENLPQQTIAI